MSTIIELMLSIKKRDAFLDELRENNLYDDFEMICGDIYVQMFHEWTRKNELSF